MAGQETRTTVGPSSSDVIRLPDEAGVLDLPNNLARADAMQAAAILDYLDHRQSEQTPETARILRPASRWQRAVEAVHGAARHPATFVIDGLVLVGVGIAAGARVPIASITALAVIVALHVGRIYADRGTVQTQGALWSPPRLVLPVGLFTLIALVSGVMSKPV